MATRCVGIGKVKRYLAKEEFIHIQNKIDNDGDRVCEHWESEMVVLYKKNATRTHKASSYQTFCIHFRTFKHLIYNNPYCMGRISSTGYMENKSELWRFQVSEEKRF